MAGSVLSILINDLQVSRTGWWSLWCNPNTHQRSILDHPPVSPPFYQNLISLSGWIPSDQGETQSRVSDLIVQAQTLNYKTLALTAVASDIVAE